MRSPFRKCEFAGSSIPAPVLCVNTALYPVPFHSHHALSSLPCHVLLSALPPPSSCFHFAGRFFAIIPAFLFLSPPFSLCTVTVAPVLSPIPCQICSRPLHCSRRYSEFNPQQLQYVFVCSHPFCWLTAMSGFSFSTSGLFFRIQPFCVPVSTLGYVGNTEGVTIMVMKSMRQQHAKQVGRRGL